MGTILSKNIPKKTPMEILDLTTKLSSENADSVLHRSPSKPGIKIIEPEKEPAHPNQGTPRKSVKSPTKVTSQNSKSNTNTNTPIKKPFLTVEKNTASPYSHKKNTSNHPKSPQPNNVDYTSPGKKKTGFGKLLTPRIPPSPPASPQLNVIVSDAEKNTTSKTLTANATVSPMKPRSPPETFSVSDKIIGEGAFSKIRLGSSLKTGQKVAVKTLKKQTTSNSNNNNNSSDDGSGAGDLDLTLIRRERDILQKLGTHPNIVRLYASVEDEKNVSLYLQYVEGGDLYSWVCDHGRIQERVSRPLFRQMVAALAHCHNAGICHRDLKLENFLLDRKQMRVILIDFGFATSISTDKIFKDYPGSPAYACPSILRGEPYDGPSADVYALGVVLFTMHFSCYPFYADDIVQMCRMICDSKLLFPSHVPTTPQLLDMLKGMLQKQSAARSDLNTVKNHSWLAESVQPSPMTKKLMNQVFRNSASTPEHF